MAISLGQGFDGLTWVELLLLQLALSVHLQQRRLDRRSHFLRIVLQRLH